MTRQEAEYLLAWLCDTYPRNYKDMDARREATTIDNLTKTFAHFSFGAVQAEYERMFGMQTKEPHPSDVRANLKSETKRRAAKDAEDPYEKLKKLPEYDEMCHAYGERACRRAAKLCVEKASIDELKFRLEHDIPCTEKNYDEQIKRMKMAQRNSL